MNEMNTKNTKMDEDFLKKANQDLNAQKVKEALSSEFDIDLLIKKGKIEKEIEPIKGLKLTIHTLSEAERQSALEFSPKVNTENVYQYIEKTKIPTLAYAISFINGKKVENKEEKQKLFDLLSKLQSAIVDQIFVEYSKMIEEQQKMLQDENMFKKK